MRMKTTSGIVVALVAVAMAAAPALAEQKRRVVVLGFTGPAKEAKQAEKTVTRALREAHEIVSTKQFVAARRALKANKPTDKNYARVAADIGADAIVSGELRRRGARRTLELTVREGKTGKVIDTARIPVRGKTLTVEAVRTDLYDLVAWAEPIEDWDKSMPPKPDRKGKLLAKQPAKPDRKARQPEPVTEMSAHAERRAGEAGAESKETEAEMSAHAERRAGEASAESKETGIASTGDAAVDALAASGSPAPAGRGIVHAGMSFVGRDLTFQHQASLMPDQQPTSYDGGVVGGVYLQGEVHPTRFMKQAPARKHLDRVAVAFELDNAIGLRSQYDDGMQMRDFTTSQLRWGLGVRYALDLGKPTVRFGAGYNRLSHKIDTGTVDIGLPDVSYKYLDVGAGASYALSPRLAAHGAARYLAVIGAGEIVTANAYGSASVKGIDVDAGVEYTVTPRIAVRGGVRYLRMAFDFDGSGAMATDRDGDPDQDVGGAADKYVGGYVQAGYNF
jgi:hypothetical protein